jgi:hypothetical protein
VNTECDDTKNRGSLKLVKELSYLVHGDENQKIPNYMGWTFDGHHTFHSTATGWKLFNDTISTASFNEMII